MKALITGITGFAGSHLAEHLLGTGDFEVFGTARPRSRMDNITHLADKISLIDCDMRDAVSVRDAIDQARPDFIFHLAAQSFVPTSWRAPAETLSTNILGEVNVFEACRELEINPAIQLACSSEEYGMVYENEIPIKETNPLRPLSPYGVSKVTQDLLGYQYWESYGMRAIRTRAFNHTGPRRGDVFVTSNFACQIAKIEKGAEPVIRVGNLNAVRDFTDVRDIVRGYRMAVTACEPGVAYNISSDTGVRVGDMLNMLLEMSATAIEIQPDEARMRPSDVEVLVGDSTLFRKTTGWKPEIPFETTLKDLLDYWRALV